MSGVLAGSLGTSLSDPGTFLAGASGGVYALIAAHLATMLLNFREDSNIRIRKVTPETSNLGHHVCHHVTESQREKFHFNQNY